jgi:ribosome biogenesis GTPase
LINSLLESDIQRTAEVRIGDSRGRHATTSRELFFLPGGGLMIDNPGLREIQLWGDGASIETAFNDIHLLALRCRFKDCSHITEPDCAVRGAVEEGELSRDRYENYLKMVRELQHLKVKADKGAQAAERDRWKPIMKGSKHYQRYKRTRS